MIKLELTEEEARAAVFALRFNDTGDAVALAVAERLEAQLGQTPCTRCGGFGMVYDGQPTRRPCPTCQGRFWVPRT